MEIQHSDVGNVRKIMLTGRMDAPAVDRVETKFSALIVPQGRNTIVDLREVTFLASMGIRMLISTARALSRKGGKLVLFGATQGVADVIETAALTDIIPLAATESEAMGLVTAG
jgi:anti-anti-sigma factor